MQGFKILKSKYNGYQYIQVDMFGGYNFLDNCKDSSKGSQGEEEGGGLNPFTQFAR